MRADEHLGWELSALIDGELDLDAELEVRRHLEQCDACRDELAEVTAARRLVRGLGDVDPPDDYLERALLGNRARYSPGLGLVGLVLLAAAWVLFLALGLEVALPHTTPPVEQFAAQHAVTADDTADAEESAGSDERAAAAAQRFQRLGPGEADDLTAPYAAPGSLSSTAFSRVDTFDADEGEVVQVLYSDGELEVSVFQQEGVLDPTSLPDDRENVEVAGADAWLVAGSGGSAPALVVQKGPIVYTVVADAPVDVLAEVAGTLPEPEGLSLGERARRNVEDLARRFGVGRAGSR